MESNFDLLLFVFLLGMNITAMILYSINPIIRKEIQKYLEKL